jgi:hypothetical protein
VIEDALSDLAVTFNRAPSWVERALDLYVQHLDQVPDTVLLDTVRSLISTQQSMPTIAELKAACQNQGARSGLLEKPRACPDCDMTGARQMAWHRMTRHGLQVTLYAGACSCPRGQQLSASIGFWQDIRERWLRDSSTQDVFVSDRTHDLTPEERYGPARFVVEKLRNPETQSAMREDVTRAMRKMRRGPVQEDRRRAQGHLELVEEP